MGSKGADQGTASPSMDHLPGLVKGAGINLGGSLAGKVLALLYMVFLTRILTTGEMGIYQLGLTVFNIVGTISLLGTDAGLLRYGPIFMARGEWNRLRGAFRLTLTVAWIVGGGLALGLAAMAGPLAEEFFRKPGFRPVILGLAPAIPFFAVGSIYLAATQARGKMQYKVYVKQLTEPLARFAVTGALFLVGWRLWGAVVSFAVSTVLGALMAGAFQARVYRDRPDPAILPPQWKEMLRFSLPLTLSRFLLFIIAWTDILMLGYLGSSEDVGIYSVTSRTAILGAMVLDAFTGVFAPMISGYHETGATDKLRIAFQSATKWGFTLTLPALLLFLVLPQDVLGIYGPAYQAGALCLVLLAAAQVVSTGTGPVGQMVAMSGRSKLVLANNLSVAGLNVLLNWTLIPRFGIAGAAAATMASIGTLSLVRLIEVRWLLGVHPYRLAFLKPIAAGALGATAAGLAGWALRPYPPLVVVLAGMSAMVLVYVPSLYRLGFDEEDRFVLGRIRERLKGVTG